MAAQEVSEKILEEANAMDESMAATWEDDAQSCKARVAGRKKGFTGLETWVRKDILNNGLGCR